MRWLPALLLACGSDPQPPSPADAGFAQDAAEPPCTLTFSAPESVAAGGRLEVQLSAEATLLLPEGWRADASTLRAPYTVGTATLTAERRCGPRTTTIERHVQVQSLGLKPLLAWQPGVDGPAEREHPQLWIDAQDPDRLWLFGGFLYRPRQFTVAWDLWDYDFRTNTWTNHGELPGAPQRAGGRIAPAPNNAVLYLGGSLQDNSQPFGLQRLNYENRTWQDINIPGVNSGDILHGFIYDAPRGRWLSACGFGDAIHCDVFSYTLDPPARVELFTVTQEDRPITGRYGFGTAYDEETERLLIVSGGQFSRTGNVNPAADSWVLELSEGPPRWVRLPLGAQDPPGRRNGCGALDPMGHRYFLWGGTPDGRTTVDGLYVLDLDRGHEGWRPVTLATQAPKRSSCSAVYDPARRRILFGFGNDADIYADLIALDL